ncbi:MAG: chemotaxis protein [Verrucomicrobiaceae bacterium]|nr:chemotaxis protein [Verrucomicrobiaceae bacterium]
MRNNQPVTQREVQFPAGDFLMSTTDLKGVITDANEAFLRVSGFSRDELIGNPHNLLRHPDMPQVAFADLWSRLRQGKGWMGIIKNRCKNGDFYYVSAHVTPIFDGDHIVGYQSVRTKPERDAVTRAERVYAQLRSGKNKPVSALSLSNVSHMTKSLFAAVLIALPALVSAALGGSWIVAALTVVLAGGLALVLGRSLNHLAQQSRGLFDDKLARLVYTGRSDEIGQVQVTLQALRALSQTILGRVSHATSAVAQVAGEAGAIVEQTTDGVRRQQLETDMVATAMNEMSATVNEVARNAEETARASQAVLGQTEAGAQLVKSAIADIEALSQAVADATRVIEQLQTESQSIGSVVDVISNIASETNLLALNAAIEAARAGDQGRGFAVVADEVRNLASHTQKSTDEIQHMIKSIQQSSVAAVEVMQAGQQRAAASVDLSRRVGQSFQEISTAIDQITGMNAQVATASEEQTAVSEEINRNLVAITSVANETLISADQTAAASSRLHKLVGNLQSMLRQFGVR